MKNSKWWVLGAVLGLTTGCASAMQVRTLVPNHVMSPIYVEPLDFSAVPQPADVDAAHWRDDCKAAQEEFAAAWPKICPKAKVMVPGIRQGVVVKPRAMFLERHYNIILGGDDYLVVEVDMFDAATGTKVEVVDYRVDSRGFLGALQLTLWGRMSYLGQNAGTWMGSILADHP